MVKMQGCGKMLQAVPPARQFLRPVAVFARALLVGLLGRLCVGLVHFHGLDEPSGPLHFRGEPCWSPSAPRTNHSLVVGDGWLWAVVLAPGLVS